MIICTREEANNLIQVESNLFKQDERNRDVLDYETILLKRGRDKAELSDEKRREIATLALTSGLSQIEVAELVGVSEMTVSSTVNGMVGTSGDSRRTDEELIQHVDETKDGIAKQAKNKLLLAMEAITMEKIANAKLKDISGLAKDMSTVMKNMQPDGPAIQNNQFVVYQPRVKNEDDFKVIEVKE